MEKRWSARHPLSLSAQLVNGSETAHGVRIREVSMEGVFVECDAPTPAPNEPIRLRFSLDAQGDPHNYDLAGRVTHHADDGFGVAFDDPDPKLCRQLSSVLYPKTPPDD